MPAAQVISADAQCTVMVDAGAHHLADALAKAPTGARLCLAPGVHEGGLTLVRSVTLQAQAGDPVIVRGTGRAPVFRIDDDGLAVRLQGLTVQGGVAEAGGGLLVNGRGKVQVSDCIFEQNQGGLVGGGAVYVRAGLLALERCVLRNNRGRQGGALMADMATRVELTRCQLLDNQAEIGGALRVAEAAEVVVKASVLQRNVGGDGASVHVSGTRSRKPQLRLDHTEIADGNLINGPALPGDVTVAGCRLPQSWKSASGLHNTGRTTFVPSPANPSAPAAKQSP